ncbi:hypothetical protein HPB51_001580 [Rhipicephalus microplus]|uniref:HAT C-terminal dimerisation domain-containing protein n=1 Tax=Rhipicephalus microplus TaxID=6941 RepID=A0A9J6D3A9_RHIMP|nr:hypothetical protein HPB51_001580 [Rhipicephalus microplus]
MFPDSKEAKNYACARTKTTAIVKEMANKAIDEVISHLQHALFSVATDGSNDAGNDAKLYPIVVTFCDSTVRTALLAMPALEEGRDVNSALDDIQAEFTRLQLEELPAEVPKEQQIDEQWRAVSGLREVNGSFKYARLSKFMLGVLTLPHSNAECERVFSKVKKAHTQFRASMSKKTVEQLLVARCAQSHSGKCHEQVFDKDFLRKAKAATASMLAHPSTSET